MKAAPAFPPRLFLCVLAFLRAVSSPGAEPAAPVAAASPAPILDYAGLQRRVDKAMGWFTKMAEAEARLEEVTASIPDAESDAAERSSEKSRDVSAALENARKQLAALITSDMPTSLSQADLDRLLSALRKEQDELTRKLAEISRQRPVEPTAGGIPGTVVRMNREGIGVFLFRNRIVATRKPYYSFNVGPGVNRATGEHLQIVNIHRVSEGKAISDALRPGDLIDQLIDEAHATKLTHYFFVRVCADSIPAFNSLCKSLNERGYDFAWDTSKDEDIIRPASGGSTSDESGIRVTPAKPE